MFDKWKGMKRETGDEHGGKGVCVCAEKRNKTREMVGIIIVEEKQ